MCPLKKGVPFFSNEVAQCSSKALNHAMKYAPLLSPMDYGKYFVLYLAAAESIIGMVLVQEDDRIQEHFIYYISRVLVGSELNYTHVEKLALTAVHAIQRLCHYILLCKTTIIDIVNPFSICIVTMDH
jgi:hypothetical protein